MLSLKVSEVSCRSSVPDRFSSEDADPRDANDTSDSTSVDNDKSLTIHERCGVGGWVREGNVIVGSKRLGATSRAEIRERERTAELVYRIKVAVR